MTSPAPASSLRRIIDADAAVALFRFGIAITSLDVMPGDAFNNSGSFLLSPTLRTRISCFESGTESRSRRGKGCSCCRFEADGNLRALLAAANANVASLENEVAGAQQLIFQNQTISKAANVIGAQVGVNVQAVRDFEDLVNSLLGTFGMAKRC